MQRTGLSRREALAAGVAGAALAVPAVAQGGDAIDRIVRDFMAAFEIPGVAIALVRPGAPVLARGYGVRRLGDAATVDANTLFAIASNSKSFTAASLALLVERGKLAWDAPVIRFMPDFAMHDPVVTQLMTVRDLLCHRSGLPLGAGDLMQFPLGNRKREEFLAGLRHLKPARGFRSGYDYDNILYVIAGILIERASGLSWEDFVTRELLAPLGMKGAAAGPAAVKTANIAARHARLGPPTRGFGTLEVVEPDEDPAASPAGGLRVSATDIVPWLSTQLRQGSAPGGRRLWSAESAAEMWAPQVITAATRGGTADNPVLPVLASYALGWFVTDYRGRRFVYHGGALSGQITQTALLPEQGIGLAVFTNVEGRTPVVGLRNALLDHVLGVGGFDWLAATRRQSDEENKATLAQISTGDFKAPPGGPSLPLPAYAGRYRDPWYGDIVVADRSGRLFIDFTRTPVFKSVLEPFGPDTFRTRFAKGAGEDAVVRFVVEDGKTARLALKPLSPLADFSYDFQHLEPVRVP